MMVRAINSSSSAKGKNFEIILLDHGLYQTLSPSFTTLYAHLWNSIIQRDLPSLQRYSVLLGGTDDTYKLISSILTGIPYDTPNQPLKNVDIAYYLPKVSSLLANVPRELMFLFKAQDLLKLVYRDLGLELKDHVKQYLIIWKYCHATIKMECKQAAREKSGLVNRWWAYVLFWCWDIKMFLKIRLAYWHAALMKNKIEV